MGDPFLLPNLNSHCEIFFSAQIFTVQDELWPDVDKSNLEVVTQPQQKENGAKALMPLGVQLVATWYPGHTADRRRRWI